MAPYPEEVDVFTVPHSRMKQLVDVYSQKLTCTDFADYIALRSLLQDLHNTFCEFKSHEQIENKYIMRKLKKRLKSLSIHDAAVCNCHSDNRLSDMLALLEDGYSCSSKPEKERINFGLKLQKALSEFTGIFLPHMKEEEEVFQPMLIKYFEYEELKCLKKQVIQEHAKWCAFELDKEDAFKQKQDNEKSVENAKWSYEMPPEVLSHIFSFLSPLEIITCSEVCRSWYDVSRNPVLWKEIYPCYWAHNIWSNYEVNHEDAIAKFYPDSPPSYKYQEEDLVANDYENFASLDGLHQRSGNILRKEMFTIDSLVKHLLPKVGTGVKKINLMACRGLTSSMVRDLLILCPNVVHLDLSYTYISDASFKGLKDHSSCQNLQHLDLSGCKSITDLGLYRLADSMTQSTLPPLPDCRSDLRDAYLTNYDQSSNRCLCGQTIDSYEIEDAGYYLQQRQLDSCADCLPNSFCSSFCFWEKNGLMCHLARQTQQCPYINSGLYSDPADISYAANQVLRTTDASSNHEDVNLTLNESNCSIYDGSVSESMGLNYLNLSGCSEITDDGMRCIAEVGMLNHLSFLDVSGCWLLTGSGLCSIMDSMPYLAPENLFYCNHIEDGPYPESANGCQNLENSYRACCCNSFL